MKNASYNSIRAHIDNYLSDLIPEGRKKIEIDDLRSLFYGNYNEPDADTRIYDEVCFFL